MKIQALILLLAFVLLAGMANAQYDVAVADGVRRSRATKGGGISLTRTDGSGEVSRVSFYRRLVPS